MSLAAWRHAAAERWPALWTLSVIVLPSLVIVLAFLYVIYRLVDPLPPRRFVVAAGIVRSGHDNYARRYAEVLARDGVALEIRNTTGAVEDLCP